MIEPKLETTALISKVNYNQFRIRCIMLILGNLKIIINSDYERIELFKVALEHCENLSQKFPDLGSYVIDYEVS